MKEDGKGHSTSHKFILNLGFTCSQCFPFVSVHAIIQTFMFPEERPCGMCLVLFVPICILNLILYS